MTSRKGRSKTGCTTCLRRKIKCDEQRSTCQQCVKAGVKCSWDLSSRIHVQEARRQCRAISNTKVLPSSGFSGAKGKTDSYMHDSALTGKFETPSFDCSSLEAPAPEKSHANSPFLANDGIGRHAGAAHARDPEEYCLSRDSLFGRPNSLPYLYVLPLSLPCANSVLLSYRDRLYLEYFPSSSLVRILGKAYTWSNLRYLCINKASEDAIVMYAIMALSASEMSQSSNSTNAQDEGRLYYSLAVNCIADAVNNLTWESNNMEAVLGALFLVITYEWRFGLTISGLQAHIHSLLKCLTSFTRLIESESTASIDLTTCPSFTPFCAQILLWIVYIESSCIRGSLSFGLMDHFNLSEDASRLHGLFSLARHSYLFMHGEHYPAEQHQDDLENYSPLELIHQDYIFRYRICRLAHRYQRGEPVQSELDTLYREIALIRVVRPASYLKSAHTSGITLLRISQAFRDLFQLQKSAPRSFCHRRAFLTLSEGLAGYYCNILLISRLFRYRVIPLDIHEQALSELFDICYTIHEWYPFDPTFGFAWYLLIAGLETKDQIHRQWAYNQLKVLGERWNTCKWAGNMLRLVYDPEGTAALPEDTTCFLRFIQQMP